jgi:hypothetical protein
MFVVGTVMSNILEGGLNKFERLFIDVCEFKMEGMKMDLTPNHFEALSFSEAEASLLADKYDIHWLMAMFLEDFSKSNVIPVNFLKSKYHDLALYRFISLVLSNFYFTIVRYAHVAQYLNLEDFVKRWETVGPLFYMSRKKKFGYLWVVGVGLASNFLILWYLLSMEMNYVGENGGAIPLEWAKQFGIAFADDVLIQQPLNLAVLVFAFQLARKRLPENLKNLFNLSPEQYAALVDQHAREKQLENSGQTIILRRRALRPERILNSAAAHITVTSENVGNDAEIMAYPKGEQPVTPKSKSKKSKSKKSMRKAKHCDEEIELTDFTEVIIDRARKRARSKSQTSNKNRSKKLGSQNQSRPVYTSKSNPTYPSRGQHVHGVSEASFGESLIDNATLPVPESQPETSMQRRGSVYLVLAIDEPPTNKTKLSTNEPIEALDITLEHGDERQILKNLRRKSESVNFICNTSQPAEEDDFYVAGN